LGLNFNYYLRFIIIKSLNEELNITLGKSKLKDPKEGESQSNG